MKALFVKDHYKCWVYSPWSYTTYLLWLFHFSWTSFSLSKLTIVYVKPRQD